MHELKKRTKNAKVLLTLETIVENYSRSNICFGLLFHQWVGLHFGRFFYKLSWSPCRQAIPLQENAASTICTHRNLKTRTCTYVGTGPENIFFGKRTPCKKLPDIHPRQDNLLLGKKISAVYKTSLHFTK
jgi:hypothetical protein